MTIWIRLHFCTIVGTTENQKMADIQIILLSENFNLRTEARLKFNKMLILTKSRKWSAPKFLTHYFLFLGQKS